MSHERKLVTLVLQTHEEWTSSSSEWINDDRNVIFGWTVPLKSIENNASFLLENRLIAMTFQRLIHLNISYDLTHETNSVYAVRYKADTSDLSECVRVYISMCTVK